MLFFICNLWSLFEVGGRDCSARTPRSRRVLVKPGPALVPQGWKARNNDLMAKPKTRAYWCRSMHTFEIAAAPKGRRDRSITWSRMESRLHIVQPSAHSAHKDPGTELTRPGKEQFAALQYICECTLCAPESHTHVTLRSWRSFLLPPQPCLI
jgi:hypothetical protein